ncbi:flagellar assembly protein A [Desulfosoma sp.]|uniref:flagellar assembly protein A n=1 Tax=Desulfosoma sp. TaxID=2603217 RepID=UPI00404A70E5
MALENKDFKTNAHFVFGKLVIRYGLATKEIVQKALKTQEALAAAGEKKHLGEILVDMGVITPSQMKALLKLQRFIKLREQERPLLHYAVTKGLLLPRDEKRALARQMELFKRERKYYAIEQILYEENILDHSAIEALKDAFAASTASPTKTAATPEAPTMPPSTATFISPERLQVLEEVFDVVVSSDRLEASLVWTKKPPPNLTLVELRAFIEKRGICYGTLLSTDIVTKICAKPGVKGSVVVARGDPPVPGRNASIQYHFDTDPLKVGRLRKGGSVDFRDRGEIPLVREGDLLAERIPPTPGTPGTDVFGHPIEPPKPMDIILRCGKGVVRSEDGCQVLAARSGRPQISADGKISVHSELEIFGDVDLKTGHVIFDGDVKISGAITAGFRVKAASVTAAEVHGAEILAEGNVMISGGVINAFIQAEGQVKARHLAGSTVRACGDVAVSSSIVDCTLETSGSLLAPTATVLSSQITAAAKMFLLHVGSEKSKACRLVMGEDPILKRRLSGLRDRMQHLKNRGLRFKKAETRQRKVLNDIELAIGRTVQFQDRTLLEIRKLEEDRAAVESPSAQAQLENLQKAIQDAEQKVEKLFQVQDALKSSLRRLVDRCSQCARDLADLEEEVRGLTQWAKMKKERPEITVEGVVAAGTVIIGPESSWKAVESLHAVRFTEKSIEDPQTGVVKKKLSLSGLS